MRQRKLASCPADHIEMRTFIAGFLAGRELAARLRELSLPTLGIRWPV